MTAAGAARRLLVMRHAKSDWYSGPGSDFDRPLAKRGERDAPRMGRWLREQGLIPDRVVSSPAVRARQTCCLVCESLAIKKGQIHWEPEIYAAEVTALLNVLARCPEKTQRVLLIGHNPGLEDLVAYLAADTGGLAGRGKLMPTGAVVGIRLPDSWAGLRPGCGHIESHRVPKELSAD
ncbi:MAG: 2,3-bisphosphoglycerate-dependent phosphoglycerate mutase [Chromatiales bacterium USCg_Taylor]|nr:MAG: 2,3-bisphosphoglycerate-dependent phosphoglycerate mutase [Chromatiales bacterium USCg_Taylor]